MSTVPETKLVANFGVKESADNVIASVRFYVDGKLYIMSPCH